MGIIISNYRLYNGSIKVNNVYLKIRDIRSNKTIEQVYDLSGDLVPKVVYELSFTAHIEKDGEKINGFYHEEKTDTVNNDDVWKRAYDLVKEILIKDNYTFSDVLV